LPRNGSGTYTTPNSFSAGSTIASAQVNANFTDVGSEITGSLPTNGEKGMSGQFKAASGTVLLPGIAFGADTDCGFYRIGADNVGLAIAGAKVLDISATGVAVTGAFSGNGATPVGAVSDYAGSTAPTGWLLCYGQAVSRSTYSALFAVISTDYGVGDGSTTFNVPDCRGRVVAGQDDMGGTSANRLTGLTDGVNGDTLGGTGGLESTTLAAANLPNTTLTVTDAGHSHNVNYNTNNFSTAGGTTAVTIIGSAGGTSGGGGAVNATTGISVAIDSTARGGAQTAINSVQPTIILNKIIFANA
jgi:microcystin-dependent protein